MNHTQNKTHNTDIDNGVRVRVSEVVERLAVKVSVRGFLNLRAALNKDAGLMVP